MITLYPAIDLKEGQAVRLFQGDFDKLTVYAPDPGAQAKKFADSGCKWIHVVDLDGAVAGKSRNNVAVKDILKTGVKVQLGGGIRTMKNIETLLSLGISRIVLGTVALKDPELVKEAASSFPRQIAVGADDVREWLRLKVGLKQVRLRQLILFAGLKIVAWQQLFLLILRAMAH